MTPATGRTYPIKNLITYNTTGVVYVLECDCGLQYIGRTLRLLSICIAKHVNNIKNGIGDPVSDFVHIILQ